MLLLLLLLLLICLVLKLRGSSVGYDLFRPPECRRKRISPGHAARLIERVSAGDEEAALRMIRDVGYEDTEAHKVLALVIKVEDYGKAGPGCGSGAPSPIPGTQYSLMDA